jgi:murein L,D-transpeptidase YcbB/YkuD
MRKIVIGIAAVAMLSSCQQVAGWFGRNNSADSTTLTSENAHAAKLMRDESITKENAYSDLFLDSATLENYIQKQNITGDKADRMRNFYLVRNNQFAWFTSGGLTEQARGLWSLYASEDKKDKKEPAARIEERMDSLMTNDSLFFSTKDTSFRLGKATSSPNKIHSSAAKKDTSSVAAKQTAATTDSSSVTTIPFFSASDTTLMQTELALTEQFVQLASEGKGLITADNFYWLVPRKKMDAMQLADSLLNKQKDSAMWQNNAQYTALKSSLQPYYSAAKNGGWQPIPSAAGLQKGRKSPAVVLLKKRLAATGDYPVSDTSNIFSDSLVTAVKSVQEQYGLTPTGRVTDSLINELNVPAQERMQQILVNMNRVLWMPQKDDSVEIRVNIPSLELIVYRDTTNVMSMPVVVGKEGAGTIAFRDQITQVVFSPYWNIPQSIVQREIKPAMKKNPNYLQKKHMEIVKQDDSLPQIRQLPGKDNALGRVKFLFPNSFDIYLHDTPDKNEFAQQNRALSHGCIRVAQPDSLAHFVLRNQPEWTPEKIAEAMNSGKEQKVDVKKPVPVVITYYTAWMGKDGKMNFRKDVYGYDQKTAARMFTNATLSTASPA